MKKTFFAASFIIFTAVSCKKSDDATPAPAASATVYMSLAAGSTRNYDVTNNTPPASTTNYTLTSTAQDTTVIVAGATSRVYHVFTNSASGGSEYYNKTGSDYYTYQNLPAAVGSTSVHNLYLKDNAVANANWVQSYNVDVSGVPVTVNVTNTVVGTGQTRTVNSISYDSVIQVRTGITANSPIGPVTGLTTDINTWYAPRVGQIENTTVIDLNFMGITNHTDTRTILKTSSIQ